MSQTKRRRRSKHRGNAAGVVEARGRTGRPPTTTEKKTKGAARPHRLDQPPTWASVAKRTVLIIGLFVVIVGVVTKPPIVTLVVLSVFMFLIYVPLGYHTDAWLYRRRAKQRAEGHG
jgi:hypothetical protein